METIKLYDGLCNEIFRFISMKWLSFMVEGHGDRKSSGRFNSSARGTLLSFFFKGGKMDAQRIFT